jgi:hypothetical protein
MKSALSSALLQMGAIVCCAVPVVGNLAPQWESGTPVVVSAEEAAQVRGGSCPYTTNNWFTALTCQTSQNDSCTGQSNSACSSGYSCPFNCSQNQYFANYVKNGTIGYNVGWLNCNWTTRAPCVSGFFSCKCDSNATPINAACNTYSGPYSCGY